MFTIGIVLGSFHRDAVGTMLAAAREAAAKADLRIAAEIWVPGSMEKPLAVKRLLVRPEIDGAVALGIIEKGETAHGLVMGQAAIGALIALQLDFMKPVGIGILGPEIHPSQIPPRLVPYAEDAVKAVAAMLTSGAGG